MCGTRIWIMRSLHWKTFPEILEDNNISWKFYQNEVSIDVGFKDEQDPWLSNFQDNPLEFFSQYNIRLHNKHLDQVRVLSETLPAKSESCKNRLRNFRQLTLREKQFRKRLMKIQNNWTPITGNKIR